MSRVNVITQERARQLFRYEDGNLYWNNRPREDFVNENRFKGWNTLYAGKEAGSMFNVKCKKTYVKRFILTINNIKFYRHYVNWVYHNGSVPMGLEVDHINGDSTDDRIENLRLATPSQNTCNRKTPSNNTSGHKGVNFNKKTGRWVVHFSLSFASLEEAAEARSKMLEFVHGEFARTE